MIWPEPVQRVQSLAESGVNIVPSQYVRPPAERPSLATKESQDQHTAAFPTGVSVE